MGKAIFSSTRSNATTALLREWTSAYLQGMLDAGFVQTADTGQLNPATVELSASAVDAGGTGYFIFRFDDALQATHPVFFKLEVSISSVTTTTTTTPAAASFAMTIGRGSNGSGGITSVILPRYKFGGQALSSYGLSTPLNHLAVSGAGYAGVFSDVNSANFSTPVAGFFFLIERSRNTSGAPTGDGLLFVGASQGVPNSSTYSSMQGSGSVELTRMLYENRVLAINYETGFFNMGPSPAITAGTINGAFLTKSTSLASGSIGPVFPWDVVAPGLAPWRSCALVSIPAGDLPGSVFQTNLCGTNGTFYPILPSLTNNRWGFAMGEEGVSRWFGAGVRWE